jgi:hypothetical protein
MIRKHGEQKWYAMSGDRSICPDKKYVDNLWSRLHLREKGTLNGPDSVVRAVQWVDDYNKLDGVGLVDNRPSTEKLHHFVRKKEETKEREKKNYM